MNNRSELYASARIAARESAFLTEEDFARLVRAGGAECERLLAERGKADERAERAERFAFFREICTKPAFLACFEAREDAFNAKCARKFRATGNPAFRSLASDLGRVPADRVFESAASGNFSALPARLAAALASLPVEAGPQEIDRALDAAYYAERAELARPLPAQLRRLFALETDLLNLGTLYRCRALGERALPHLAAGGELPPEKLAALEDVSDEELAQALGGAQVRPFLQRALAREDVSAACALQEIRLGLPLELLDGLRTGFFDQVRYWYRREGEMARVRRIRNAKRNGIPFSETAEKGGRV